MSNSTVNFYHHFTNGASSYHELTDASAPFPTSPHAWEEILIYIFSQAIVTFSTLLKTSFQWDTRIVDI